VKAVGVAEIVKLELGLPGMVSGAGVPVPLAIVTHMPPLTLVSMHPVWKLMTVPEVVAMML